MRLRRTPRYWGLECVFALDNVASFDKPKECAMVIARKRRVCMHKILFYPLGNADTALISLENGKDILIDFADVANPDDPKEKRIALAPELRRLMSDKNKDYFDIVAFSHGDNDHTKRASEFFHLEFANAYQGEGRYKIRELWVPAAMIVEEGSEDDARIIRQEARHRLRRGVGIRVFSRPAQISDWLEKQGLSLESRLDLITDAGQIVPGLSLEKDGVEFFVHSPFAHRQSDEILIDRNNNCLVLQATFQVSGMLTRMLLLGDITWKPLDDLISITQSHGRDERLFWDVCKLSHHCSSYALSEIKGRDKTIPTKLIDWLYAQRSNGAIQVSSSDPIPSFDTVQPPHFQAENYYRDRLREVQNGKFLVTMAHPTEDKPQKIEIEIGTGGAKQLLRSVSGASVITSRSAPRVG
jgi:hypothetical protein